MAVTGKMYANFPLGQYGGAGDGTSQSARRVDWLSDTIKVMLCTSSYTPAQTTHCYRSSVTNEVTGTGYTAGGATLGSKLAVISGLSSNIVCLDAADTSWTTATITARYAVIYKDTGSSATDPVLGYVDFGADTTATAGTFSITWDTYGIFQTTVS